VSAVLNGQMEKGFNTFVNEYRVSEVKEKLLQPENNHLTIFGIASGCGFHSQATLQRVFKEITEVSPSAFRKNATQIRV
jgi:AraC-like DNA-binding protein